MTPKIYCPVCGSLLSEYSGGTTIIRCAACTRAWLGYTEWKNECQARKLAGTLSPKYNAEWLENMDVNEEGLAKELAELVRLSKLSLLDQILKGLDASITGRSDENEIRSLKAMKLWLNNLREDLS